MDVRHVTWANHKSVPATHTHTTHNVPLSVTCVCVWVWVCPRSRIRGNGGGVDDDGHRQLTMKTINASDGRVALLSARHHESYEYVLSIGP